MNFKAIQLDPTYELALTNRKMVEALENGEKLGMDTEVEMVEYYKDRFLRRRIDRLFNKNNEGRTTRQKKFG